MARRYHYDEGLLRRFLVVRDDRPVAVTAFTHDPDGRIATERDDDRGTAFRYDPAGQLVYAGPDGAGRERDHDAAHISYDTTGNRVLLKLGGSETRYRYDEADQLSGAETSGHRIEFRYDSSGRLIEEIDGERRRSFGTTVSASR